MMPIKKIVINTSPLITLFRSQQDDLLPQLFDKIYVPDAVWSEVVLSGKQDIAAEKLPTHDWYIKLPPVTFDTDIQLWNLGAGESEVMHHTRQMGLNRAIVDNKYDN